MTRLRLAQLCLPVTLIATLVTPATAGAVPQGYSYSVPLDLALEAAREAIRVCESNGYRVTATVVDMAGTPKVVLRGDKATVHTGESSFRKAFTVVTLGPEFNFDASSGFFQMQKTNPFASQLATVHNVMALPGAVAFMSKGEMIGALGIGGAPGGDKDEVCARAGVNKVKSRLPQ
ncbi:GlcG/HbpS family heme-binding protein [Dongia sedimenti]|uniref:Heme-binding protein n=1 Tax=Dongia sedimenti TaxID=3064282 RepID=A0ABU0YVR2_9PROT|nr:heme-binding protein [Rhodospirillaceae bacterium R-7]